MKRATYTIVLTVLLIGNGVAHADENVIELKDSSVFRGNVTWINGENVTVQVDKGSVKTIDGQPLKEFEPQWITEKKKEQESKDSLAKEFYEELIRSKSSKINIDKEWELLKGADSTVNLLNVGSSPQGETVSLKKDDVFRHLTDGKNQSIIEFVALEGNTIMDKKYYFLIKDDGSLSYVSSQAYSYSGTTKDHLKRKFTDEDKDGLADNDEKCNNPDDIFGFGKGLFSECRPTDPKKRDTDGDGWWDGFEQVMGTDPTDKSSYPSKDASAQFHSINTQTTKKEIKSE